MTVYDAIEQAVSSGIKSEYIEQTLIKQGWPPPLVREALEAWLVNHGRAYSKTDIKKWIRHYRVKATPYVLIIVFVSLLASAVFLLKPWPIKIMVDSVFGNVPAPSFLEPYTGTEELLFFLAILSGLIFIVSSLLTVLKELLVLRFSYKININLKVDSLSHLLNLPLFHKDRLAKGDYIYRQNNLTDSLASLVLGSTANIAQSIILILGIFIILLSINLKLAMLTIFVVPGLIILVKIFGPGLNSVSQALTKNSSQIASNITESIDNAETVQAYGLQDIQVSKAVRLWQKHLHLSTVGLIWSRSYKFSNGIVVILATSAVLYFGGISALNGTITLGELLIFMIYMGYLVGPVEGLVAEFANKNQKFVDISRVFEVLTDHQGIESVRADHHFMVTNGAIEFQNLSYSYGNDLVVNRINLSLQGGTKTAIIGPSGSGKSTILKLLPLFVEPTEGRILIDGIDIQTVSLAELRQSMVWISQTPQIFSGTLAENITQGNQNIDELVFAQALRASNVDEFMNKNPMGVNMPIAEGGVSLSGGQRQRIAIARGLVKPAPIVLMDEPTSALDDESEKIIKENISRFLQNKTVLLVTHKRLLLDLMDTVYVMKDGALVNIEELGGIAKYFGDKQVISEEDVIKQAQILELQQQKLEQDQKALQRLEAENNKLREVTERQSSLPDDGTIYINH